MKFFKPDEYKHVIYAWDETYADRLDPVGRLVYRSNLLGSDQRITNTGGGNTSSKITMPDPFTGQEVEVMFVKGSGGDLRTAQRENFASLYMDKLMALQSIYNGATEKGVKTPIEDQMVAMYPHCVYNLNPRAASIDTPLHAFIPYRHVDHTHPNAVIAIAACSDGKALTEEIYGGEVVWVDWQRPGFDLGLVLQETIAAQPGIQGIILGGHGLINWADDDKACYELSLTLIEKAARYLAAHDKGETTFNGAKYQSLHSDQWELTLFEILPRLRGMVSQQNRSISTVQANDAIMRFINSHDAPHLSELGTSCPDHFLRTKIKPFYVDWNPQQEDTNNLMSKLEAGLAQYREDYRAYYDTHKRPDSPAIRDPNPTVFLIPGLGMIAFGKNKSESRVTAEFYTNAVAVMEGAEAVSTYVALPRQEAFDIEYWELEEAKLRRMPPEKSLARNVVVIIGAGSGIGHAIAHRVAKDGAHVVSVDLHAETAQATADELREIYGMGIGVAGTGISGCGPAISLSADITNRDSVHTMLQQVVLAYGGTDNVIVTAGTIVSSDESGHISDEKWRFTFDVNILGSYIVADEAHRIWKTQNLPGTLVLTTSVNGVVPKTGSLAYDTSKAAANHLVRELAIELAPLVRVNGLAPATVVDNSNLFPRDRVISRLTNYGIDFRDDENIDTLRDKLALFYAQRTLTQQAITPEDQSEVAYLLSTGAFSRTTGQIINVDGGLREAFLR
jgi:rhamnulose-1-phosphate aldolase/alcohol dehydrogenase